MTDEREDDDIARELHSMRAEPRPEYARELDRRAAAWLRERPRRRLPSLRAAIPAVAAGAAAVAVIVALSVPGGDGDGDGRAGGGGGDRLDVTVIAAQSPTPAPAAGAEALDAAPQVKRQSGGFADVFALDSESVSAGQPFTVSYEVAEVTRLTVRLAGREAKVQVGPGPGTLEVSTESLPAGSHRLVISTPRVPAFRGRVEIRG